MVSPMLVQPKHGLGHTAAHSPVRWLQCISRSVKRSSVTVNYGSFLFSFLERKKGVTHPQFSY